MFNILLINALCTSTKIAPQVAKTKKTYAIDETLATICSRGVCLETWIFGKEGSSTTTFKWLHRLTYQANDMEDQLIDQIKQVKYFSLQPDLCNDTANMAIFQYRCNLNMMMIWRKNLFKKFFSCSLSKDTTSFQMYKAKKNYTVNRCGLEFQFCVQVCSDSTVAMIGKHSGVSTHINKLTPECTLMHFCLRWERLASKISQLN